MQEILLAMAMPDYRPAFGTTVMGSREHVVRNAAEKDVVEIVIVAPEHVTRTSERNPTLHWWLSGIPSTGAFYLTILDAADEPVVLDLRLDTPRASGLQRADLRKLGIQLPDTGTLRWSIALREEEETPPRSFGFGWLRVAPLSDPLAKQVSDSGVADRVALYAEAGCFHEALEAALLTRDRHSDNPEAKRAVSLLLEPIGLEHLAESIGVTAN